MINLYDILDAADGQLFGEPAAQIFSGISFDPRQVKQGELFVALKTEAGDGHLYMEEAIQAGASGLMCTYPPSFETHGVTVMIMRDVEAALMRWAKYALTKHSTTVIGVTGMNGKSTARAAIAQVLSTRYQVYHSKSEFSGRFGLPLSLSQLGSGHQLAVLEYDPLHPGEMAEMVGAAQTTVGVVTSLPAGSFLEGEARVLISSLPSDGLAVLNFDDPAARALSAASSAPSLTFSVDREGKSFGADLIAYNLVVALDKTGFDLRYGSLRHLARWVPLLGAHQLYAVLASLAVGLAFEVPLEEGLEALTYLEPLPGRMRPLNGTNGCLLVDDSIDANTHSLAAALDWLKSVSPQAHVHETQAGLVSPQGKIYVVLGAIGGLEARQSAEVNVLGGKLEEVASEVITEGDAAAQLSRAAVEHGFPLRMTHVTYSAYDAVMALRDRLTAKDLVLVTGSAASRMERVVAELLADPEARSLLPRQDTSLDAEWSRHPPQHTWVQIDMEAIAHNVLVLKAMLDENCKLMAVVKGDAYGHGAVPVSTTAVMNGADYLGVATPDEAIQLREAGISVPILILSYAPPAVVSRLLRYDLRASLFDQNQARTLNRIASGSGAPLKVHVRVDVGTEGMGVLVEEVAVFFRALAKLEWLYVEGVYATLDMTDRSATEHQLAAFLEAVKMLRAAEFQFDLAHIAGSAAAIHLPDTRLDMVRCGSAIYGLQPAGDLPLPEDFYPALTWKTTVVQVKRLKGRMITGADGLPLITKTRTVAVLPVGYSDGLRWGQTEWGNVLIKGQKAPFTGQVGMYQSMADVSDIDDVRVGEEAVLIGTQGGERITLQEVSAALGVPNDELVMMIMARAPRYR